MPQKRILLGKLPDATYGLRISKAGYDVTTNPPDPRQLVFDSNWPQCLPIHQMGVFNVPANTTGVSVSYPSLGYRPFFQLYFKALGITDYTFMGVPKKNYCTWQGFLSTELGDGTQDAQNAVQVSVTSTTISGYYNAYSPTKGLNYPTSFDVYYVIFKVGV